ncbi:MAG: AAA family ATPase [bacterium]|nr:AAA family ATPase [bacterium]
MKLIVIYGSPAVGKLTVARELSKITGYPVFHNHLTVDFLDSFYEGKGFWALAEKIRLDVIEAYAKSGKDGLIFTFVYSKPGDNDFVDDLKAVVEKNGGNVHFVRLFCDEKVLFERVTNESRKEFGKIKKVEVLKEDLAKDNIVSKIDGVSSLEIDTANIAASEVAEKVAKYFSL